MQCMTLQAMPDICQTMSQFRNSGSIHRLYPCVSESASGRGSAHTDRLGLVSFSRDGDGVFHINAM